MKANCWKFLLKTFLVASLWVGVCPPAKAETGLLMPMYGNTAFQFSQVYEAALKVPVIAILNPDDGVGWRKDNYIAGQVNLLKSRGVRVVGYINSEYGWRDNDEVDDECDKYRIWYGVNGIFLDEVSGAASKLSYYKSIRSYANLIGIGFTVLNPGTPISSSFLQAGDILVDYEHADWQINFATAGAAGWVAANPHRAAAIVYGVAAGGMAEVISAAIAKNYGWVYVTDQNEPDPFGNSAGYFLEEVDDLYAMNHPGTVTGPPPPGAGDPFRILSSELGAATPGGEPDRMKITVKTIPGRIYELQCSTTMSPGSWQTARWVGDKNVLLRGQIHTTVYYWEAGLIAGATQCFFRVADVTP